MAEGNKSALRIDWFDGTLIEYRSTASTSASEFADEDQQEPPPAEPPYMKKPISFTTLLDISLLQHPVLTLEVSNRPGFWMLLDTELKGDFICLLVKVLANIFNSLKPGEKSKITFLLKEKFEKSIFINTLKEFIVHLPNVRIVEKKMNRQLWDNAEDFYSNVVFLCEGIVKYYQRNITLFIDINDLLDITETSAIGVIHEHMETFSDKLFLTIQQLQSKIVKLLEKITFDNASPQALNIENEDPNSFRRLSIFPTKEDLLGKNQPQLQPNILNGAYSDVEHYLDLQFRLLREDCFGPLRDGICKYLENPSKRRFKNIRVHPRVRIIQTYVSNNKVGHLVDIMWKERISQGVVDGKKYAYNKQLMFGSLLLFTNDNFETILCATVLDSSMSLLALGYVAVSFQNPVSKKIFSEAYLMVESEVFFEPYHGVLKVLQYFKHDDMPMRKYIVDVQTETQAPSYLNPQTVYSVAKTKTSDDFNFTVFDSKTWPQSKDFGFDDSQMEAYKFALTREFAVIQGPPGTGKTFIGIKIASTILENMSLEGTPMLIICYTNHALDQFLEGILNVTKNIVRLGSQSKSKKLESYTLHNLRAQVKSKYSHLFGKKRSELERIFKEMTDLQTELEKCEKEIISYKTLKPYLKLLELKKSNEDPVLSWLFDDFDNDTEESAEEYFEDWEKQFDDVVVDVNKIETCFSEKWALKEIDSMKNSIRYVKDVTDDLLELQNMTDKFEAQIDKIRKRLNCLKMHNSLDQKSETIREDDFGKITNLYSLTLEQRWSLYNKCVGSIKNELLTKMNSLLEQHNACGREMGELSTLIDSDAMRGTRVVGVTTTTAARRHDLMRQLLSHIVIVEEAAEVLEAHIVASLTTHCQHLILIGDHKQLRPTAAHYRLAKHYNLEVSLFERMVRNGVHVRTLTIQRRMRPSFVDLLVPVIYDRLDSHPTVCEYPHIRGMKENLYFYTHDDVLEDTERSEESWSYKSTFEAKWCVALADYLRQMKYTPDEITILSPYTGQVALIKELSKKYTSLRDVKITVVDNYQGEENRIILLSLVRSNRDLRIGFLAAANRICVALSRAKEGFYLFGNMNVLKSSSNIWRLINDKLVAQGAIGSKLTLRCDTHKDNTFDISNPEDLHSALSGSCLKICKGKSNF